MNTHVRFITLGFALWTGLSAAAETPAFLERPKYVGPPSPLQAVTNRALQGIPSMAVAPGGRLWATWYARVTPGEDHNNYVVLSTSGDNGKGWKEVPVVDPDKGDPVRTFGQCLFVNVDCPDGELRAELLDAKGRVIKPYTLENCEPAQADTTIAALKWKGASEVAPPSGKPVRVRFSLRNGSLYSFWFSKTSSGASGGYLAAGKLKHPSIIDE
jgi:hypothetical protein